MWSFAILNFRASIFAFMRRGYSRIIIVFFGQSSGWESAYEISHGKLTSSSYLFGVGCEADSLYTNTIEAPEKRTKSNFSSQSVSCTTTKKIGRQKRKEIIEWKFLITKVKDNYRKKCSTRAFHNIIFRQTFLMNKKTRKEKKNWNL